MGPKSRKRKVTREELAVPTIEGRVRSEALTQHLQKLVQTSEQTGREATLHMQIPTAKRDVLREPQEYLFSHVRQTMWIEYLTLSGESSMPMSWVSSNGQESRWMSKHDMDKVGITSIVKKIL